MDKLLLKKLIKRYEDVYLFATKRLSTLISEEVLDDLTLEQFSVLRHLVIRGPLRLSDLAEYCGVQKSAATAKIDRLVTKGLVERIRDHDDRRNVYVSMTNAGEEIYLKGQEKIESFVENYLQELSTEEIESFLTIYEKISHIIEKRHGGE